MSVDEYLEKLFSESFKREFDQDESIWRTLPFFATGLTLAGTLFTFALTRVVMFEFEPIVHWLVWAVIVGAGLSLFGAFGFLFSAVGLAASRFHQPRAPSGNWRMTTASIVLRKSRCRPRTWTRKSWRNSGA